VSSRTPTRSRTATRHARWRGRACRQRPRLQAGEHAPFVILMFVPGSYAVIAGRPFGVRWYQLHGLLPRKALRALDVPATGELGVIASGDVAWRLVRRVAGAKREPGQIGTVGDMVADKTDRPDRPGPRSDDSRWHKCPEDQYACCRRRAPAHTDRSRHRGSRRSGRSGQPSNGPVAPLSVKGVTCHIPTM
jgi:hypothetical protein